MFVASKNGLAASAGASAYCTAKAAEMHLARCLALEGAPHGIRVNVVNPGRGAARLEDLGTANGASSAPPPTRSTEDELEEVYRQRSHAEAHGVARGHRRGASTSSPRDLSAKSTGNILNVDAGNAQAFTR